MKYFLGLSFGFYLIFSTTNLLAQNQYLSKTLLISGKEWCVENLRTDKFSNGEKIPFAKDSSDWLKAALLKQPAYGIIQKGKRQEYVYNFYAIIDERVIVPKGYSLPDYTDFENFGKELKSKPSLINDVNLYSIGSFEVGRTKNEIYYNKECTKFWYKDIEWANWLKDNMGTSVGLCEVPNCESFFPADCNGDFVDFMTFYEFGGSDAGNTICIRLIKNR